MDSPPLPPASASSISRWPKVIGIIAIVFGVGGLLQGALAPVGTMFARAQMEAIVTAGADGDKVDEYLDALAGASLTGAVAGVLLGALLLGGGILLLLRKRSASPVLQVWAVLKILVGGFLGFRSLGLTRVQMEIMTRMDGWEAQDASAVDAITTYAMWFGFAFGLLWLVALPVFLLIWLNRRRVVEEIAGW